MHAPVRRPPGRKLSRVLAHPGRVGVVVAVLLAAVLVTASLWTGGYRPSEVRLSSGTAWLPSPAGLVTLVDGPSEQVIGNLRPLGETAEPPAVVQRGTSALVIDRQTGRVARVDGATYAIDGPFRFGSGGALQVLSGSARAFVVDGASGEATLVDPASLQKSDAVGLGVFPEGDQAVVDEAGNLWAVGSDEGRLVKLDDSGDLTSFDTDGDAASRLVSVRGRPVLVDVSAGRLGWIQATGEVALWACEELGDDPRLLGSATSAQVFAAVPSSGELVIADLDQRRCRTVPMTSDGAGLGRPVENGSVVVVPDRTTGQAIVVDTRPDGELTPVPLMAPGKQLELLAKDGVVFYNDAGSADAGVLQFQDGEWAPGAGVLKFRVGAAEEPVLSDANVSIARDAPLQGVPPPPSSAATKTTADGDRASTTAESSTGPSSTTSGTQSAAPACGDRVDNDDDGAVDLADGGCESTTDTDETGGEPEPEPAACDDGIDNDNDGAVDLADGGCDSTTDTDEA
jgi:hypothetical protein